MRLSDYIKQIRQKGRYYFTSKEPIADLGMSDSAVRVAVHRLVARGELISPARGLYVIVPPEHQLVGCIPAEELVPILMGYFKAEYYVSILSAAQYYGAAHQRPGRFQIISNKRIKHSLKFGQIKIEVLHKEIISGLPILDKAVRTGYLKIASPELVAFDLITYHQSSGGLSHIATVLAELIESIDPKKLIDLAAASGELAWVQRLGYIIEQLDPLDEIKSNIIIDSLIDYLKDKMKKYVPLEPGLPIKGYPRDKKWMIVINNDIESDV